jgi:hypothetical protein
MRRIPKDIDSLYVDQAMVRKTYLDRNFFAAYTPWGIRQLDSRFCRRIMALKSKAEAKVIRKQIKDCAHLHDVIKDNLFLNLRNYAKSVPATAPDYFYALELIATERTIYDNESIARTRFHDACERLGFRCRAEDKMGYVKTHGVLEDELLRLIRNEGTGFKVGTVTSILEADLPFPLW